MESPWLNLLKILPPLIRLLPEDMQKPLSIIFLSALNNVGIVTCCSPSYEITLFLLLATRRRPSALPLPSAIIAPRRSIPVLPTNLLQTLVPVRRFL